MKTEMKQLIIELQFISPECYIYDSKRDVFYVNNYDGFEDRIKNMIGITFEQYEQICSTEPSVMHYPAICLMAYNKHTNNN